MRNDDTCTVEALAVEIAKEETVTENEIFASAICYSIVILQTKLCKITTAYFLNFCLLKINPYPCSDIIFDIFVLFARSENDIQCTVHVFTAKKGIYLTG